MYNWPSQSYLRINTRQFIVITSYFYVIYRKGGLLLNSFVGIGGACLMGLTKYFNSYEVLFVGRFIIGVNCGMKFRSANNVIMLHLIFY